MKYIFISFACVFVLSQSCRGMDVVKKITAIEKPTSIIALDYAHCVVAGDRCIIIDFLVPEKSKVIDKTKVYHIALNKDQTRFAISSKKKLAVYSAFTGKKLWKAEPICPSNRLAFSSMAPVLFAYSPGYLTSYNYVSKTIETHNIPSLVEYPASQISCHPTENKLLYPSGQDTLSTINFDQNYKITLIHAPKRSIISGIYSPDGNCIVINNDFHSYSIYEPSTHFCYYLPPRSFRAKIVALAFHPHRPILAILFDNNTLRFLNYKTKELICIRMHSIKIRNWINDLIPKERLSFMFDGKKLMVALKHKSLVLQVPENNLVLMYYVLKPHLIIPDLIQFIFNKFTRSFNLYFIDLIQLSRT